MLRLGVAALATTVMMSCLTRDGEDEMEYEITRAGPLLRGDGTLREAGWARRQLLRYDRALVADPARLREWDFFSLLDNEAAVNVTVGNLGALSLASVGVVDLREQTIHSAVYLRQPDDRFELSGSLDDGTRFIAAGREVPIVETEMLGGGKRRVRFDLPAGLLGEYARGDLTLFQDPHADYLSLATPFAGDPRAFFFEQKVPAIHAEGTVTIGGRTYSFDRSRTFAIIDWGRGVWPADVLWRWGAGFTHEGVTFNLGNGFGDMSRASENLVVEKGVGHKLGPVDWSYDALQPLLPWRFRDRRGRVDLTLSPIFHEEGGFDLGAYYSRLHKVYGFFDGTVTTPSGRRIEVSRALGFAEEMRLRW